MKSKLLLLIVSLLFSSCASTSQYTNTGDAQMNSEELATIYVVRPSSFGSAIRFRIFQDEKLIGKLGPNSYLSWTVKPDGKDLTIVSKSENKDMVTINPQPGKTYFIKQEVKMGIAIARTGLKIIEEQEGKSILEKLKKPDVKYAE